MRGKCYPRCECGEYRSFNLYRRDNKIKCEECGAIVGDVTTDNRRAVLSFVGHRGEIIDFDNSEHLEHPRWNERVSFHNK